MKKINAINEHTTVVIINVRSPSAFIVNGIFSNTVLKLLLLIKNNITNNIKVFFKLSGNENEKPDDFG